MICRRCGYTLTGLAVSQPDGLVRCPECATLSIVPRHRAEPVAPASPIFEPVGGFRRGRLIATLGIALAFLAAARSDLLISILAITLGAYAWDRTRGRRGLWAMILGTLALLWISQRLIPRP